MEIHLAWTEHPDNPLIKPVFQDGPAMRSGCTTMPGTGGGAAPRVNPAEN